jgi:hypothetical protein
MQPQRPGSCLLRHDAFIAGSFDDGARAQMPLDPTLVSKFHALRPPAIGIMDYLERWVAAAAGLWPRGLWLSPPTAAGGPALWLQALTVAAAQHRQVCSMQWRVLCPGAHLH